MKTGTKIILALTGLAAVGGGAVAVAKYAGGDAPDPRDGAMEIIVENKDGTLFFNSQGRLAIAIVRDGISFKWAVARLTDTGVEKFINDEAGSPQTLLEAACSDSLPLEEAEGWVCGKESHHTIDAALKHAIDKAPGKKAA